MAIPFYQLPKSQNSLCLFLLLLMFNPSASALSSTGSVWTLACTDLQEPTGELLGILVIQLTSCWWFEISRVRDIYTTETRHTHPPEPVVKPLPAHHWVYLPSMSKVGSLLTTFTSPPWLQTWDYCNRLGKTLFALLFAPLHSILNTAARMILSLQWLPISFGVKPQAPALWLPPPHSSYLSDL